MRVGIVGLGRMGTALAERVLSAGYAVSVHNRTAERAKPVLDAGATWCASPVELAESCDLIISALTDDPAVHDVYTEMLAGQVAGKLFVEASTIKTATQLRLAAKANAAGASFVDAPMVGPPAAAQAGALMVLVGGDAADFARAEPVISAYSKKIVHVGKIGAGATMKLVLMSSMASYFSGLAEGLAVGSQLGLSREVMFDVILNSHGAPPVLVDRAPLLFGEDRPVSFEVSGVRKDLQAIVATGQDAGVPMATAASALNLFTAASAWGYADRDLVFVVDYMREVAARAYPEPRPDV